MLIVPHKGPVPLKATLGASGYDLASTISLVIPPSRHAVVSTGVFVEVPFRWEGQVRSRSGLAAKHGVFVLNSPGTIDSDYRGEIKVILFNSGENPFQIEVGDRIAQLVFCPIAEAKFIPAEGEMMSQTTRGSNGFGSTGVK